MLATLQTAGPLDGWLGTALQASDVVGALIGLFIAYQAYRGYRRNESRPMLFIAVGFVLALGVPVALLFVTLAVPSVPRAAVAVASQASELVGLLCILYAIRMPS